VNFEQAFSELMKHEGGYTAGVNDPGGETKYGISKRAYPQLNIGALTLDQAAAIYRRDYWGPAGCESVPPSLRMDLFDMAVNSGVRAAAKCLQRAVGETEDGVIGSRTLQAIQSMPAPRLLARFAGERLDFMTGLPAWANFGKGWARRIAANLRRI
jgi:lysozyme family protein